LQTTGFVLCVPLCAVILLKIKNQFCSLLRLPQQAYSYKVIFNNNCVFSLHVETLQLSRLTSNVDRKSTLTQTQLKRIQPHDGECFFKTLQLQSQKSS
jgi:hypothetical protein